MNFNEIPDIVLFVKYRWLSNFFNTFLIILIFNVFKIFFLRNLILKNGNKLIFILNA